MCGIAGLIPTPPGKVDASILRSLSDRLMHRGPDDYGWAALNGTELKIDREIRGNFAGDAILLHRRLSILDLSRTGRQPMKTDDDRYAIVFNGEIYNYVELRSELEALGHRFRSRSDTEVLLRSYVQWGIKSLNRLVGMFAFAVLDARERRIFLARDTFGIKPLYYAFSPEGFVFASEIDSILALPRVSRSVNPQRLYDYLRSGITDHGGETLFAGIRQLPAAHFMEIPLDRPERAEPVRYWEIDLSRKADLSFDEAARQLRDLFLDSVKLHLRSDVPVGAALSGGIDSSSIVMCMRQLNSNIDIHTFSYVADDPAISEERWIDTVSAASNATVHKIEPSPGELKSDLKRLIAVQGETFGSTSIYAQSRIFRKARQMGIKVMLDGQGADEMLGGYHYYFAARLASLLRQGNFARAAQLLSNARALLGPKTKSICSQAIGFSLPAATKVFLRRWLKSDATPRWLNQAWFDERNATPNAFAHRNGSAVLRANLLLTLSETSLPQLLRYEDRNSMSYSIESRVPFLTPALASFAFSLPEEYFITPQGVTKAVFRKAMRGIVPDIILDRRDKIGFRTPEKTWLFALRDWVDAVLTGQEARQIPALNWRELRDEWQRILDGRSQFDARVWRWINTILWVRKFGVSFN